MRRTRKFTVRRDAAEETVLKVVAGYLAALNASDFAAIGRDFLGPRATGFGFGGAGLNRYRTDGMLEASSFEPPVTLALRLVAPVVQSYDDTAMVAAYLEGSITRLGSVLEEGPWRMALFLAREGKDWRLEHVNFSKLSVPSLAYFAQLPRGYAPGSGKSWPLILFLHGAGERGDLERVKAWTMANTCVPKVAEEHPDFPFVVVTPACPPLTSWSQLPYSIGALLDEVLAKYDVDPDRVYLTGLSMGGYGTWSLAAWFPERFAAIAPVCGIADPARVERLRHIPVWAFHGALDPYVPLQQDEAAVGVLRAAGGDVRLTVYPDVGHESWERAYAGTELYDWFLRHRRRRSRG